MFNHGSRSTWGPGPSGSRLQAKKCVTLQQKHWCVLHLKFYYVFTKTHGLTVAAVDALQTLFGAPWPQGSTPGGRNIVYDLALVKLGPHTKFGEDWSNSVDFYTGHTHTQTHTHKHTHTHTDSTLYIRYMYEFIYMCVCVGGRGCVYISPKSFPEI